MSDNKTEKSRQGSASNLQRLVSHRNHIICQLWSVYRDMSDIIEAEEFTEEDLSLWDTVTKHSAIQSKLGG